MSNLLQTAKALNEAKGAYGKAIRAEMASFQPMDIDTFWEVNAVYAKKIQQRRKYGTGVKDGSHNLMCEYVYSGDGTKKDGWESMVRFLARYEQVKCALSKKLNEMPGLDRGDDGYGDLMDSLPLAGKAVFDGLMGDDIANFKQLEKALDEHPLKDFILNGENYVCMTLGTAIEKAFLSAARDLDEDEDRREPDPHVVMVTTQNKQGYTLFGMQVNVRGPFRDRYEAEAFAKQEDGACTVVKLFGGVVKK